MIESCDTNILLHALNQEDPLHGVAAAYLNAKATDRDFVICELVLAELYVLLRNPKLAASLDAPTAVDTIRTLRSNPYWKVVDHPGGLMESVWSEAARPAFPRTSIYDVRLALTLRHYGVMRFATRNVKHFQHFGFKKVFDPTERP